MESAVYLLLHIFVASMPKWTAPPAAEFVDVHLSDPKVIVGHFREAPGARDIAVFLPPATAKIEPLLSEAMDFSARGISALVLLPPYARREFDGYSRGPENPEGELEFWRLSADEICQVIAKVRGEQGLSGRVVLLGKNLGGSFAAYASTKCHADRLIAYGSVPRLSTFWLRSMHPVAQSFRNGREGLMPRFSEITRALDLASSTEPGNVPAILQLGEVDPWIDNEQREIVRELPAKTEVKWYLDDHEMASSSARADRLKSAE